MEERPPISSEQMSQKDWERMPASGKQLVEELLNRVMQLEAEIGQLRAENQLWSEQIKRTSANSSQPPSQDPPQAFKPSPKRKSGKKRGGQPGHEGHERRLYPIEQCDSVTDYYPQICWRCGIRLTGEDASPYRHQVVDIPPIELHRNGASVSPVKL